MNKKKIIESSETRLVPRSDPKRRFGAASHFPWVIFGGERGETGAAVGSQPSR